MKNLKIRVNPEELGVKIGEIRETRTKDLLVEVKCTAEDRGRLDSAFRDVVGPSESVRHLVPTVEVEILDIDIIADTEEIAEAIRDCLREKAPLHVKVCMTKRPFRGTRKAFVRLKEARASKLLKAAHIKIGKILTRLKGSLRK